GPRLKKILLRSGAVSSSDDGVFSREEYLNRGQEYEKAGQYHPAVKEYHRALRLDPNSSQAHYRLGVIYDLFLEDRAMAIHHYEIFLGGNKNSSHAPEVISRLKELRSQIGANVLSGEGIWTTPSPPSKPEQIEVARTPSYTGEDYLRKGDAWRNKGDPGRALEAYHRALKLSPSNASTYLGIGIASLDQGEYTVAVTALLKARSLGQGQPVKKYLAKAYLRLAAGSLASKDFQKSIKYCRKAHEEGSTKQADEGLWKVYHAGFRDCYEKGDYSAAADNLKSCLKLKPDVADDCLSLGDLYARKLGDAGKAKRYYAKYLELAPRGEAADRIRKIVETARPGTTSNRPSSVPVKKVKHSAVEYYNQGSRHQRAGQYELSRKEYIRAIKLKPNFYQAYYNLGIIYNKTNQPSRALAAYKKAAGLKPDFARAQLAIFNLYYYHYKMKNLARPYAERYIKLAPGTRQAAELSKWLKK
ncbi:MAG: tetratricopeptide repeat protein, partial [Candidatus Auribacterota bacterium]|nr:tetratricopeptide repeat protein [Candidatus Auribacterota bacterium]